MTMDRRARHGLLRATMAGTAVALAAALVGCQVVPPAAVHAALGLDLTPAALAEPGAVDWTANRVSGAALRARRSAYFRTMAYPAASTGWNVGATPGLPLTSYGCTATDVVPNGPAAAFRVNPSDALYGKLFFLTKNGKLLKVSRTSPATYTAWTAPAGKTFSRTYVTLSPRGARAYLLSDDGVMYVVNTLTMATAAVLSVGGGGYGIAPWIDPYASRHDDQGEVVYVASNAGSVNKYSVGGNADGTIDVVSAATTYNLATGVTPLYSGTRKIAAPPVVLGGVIYVGDMAGNFYAYDTVTPANSLTYGLGAPISTAAAIELQDGYSLTDPSGVAKSVAPGVPVYAFVTAGASVAWLNLHDATTTRSLSLRIDDNDTDLFGYVNNYSYNSGGSTQYLAAQDGGNINTESPDYNLPGTSPVAIWKNDYITPAETNTRDDGTNPLGGPVVSYLRWYTSTVPLSGQVIASATLTLTPAFDQPCRVPEPRTASSFYSGTSTPWVSSGLTNANRPAIGTASTGTYQSGGVNASGNVDFRSNKSYVWDVTAAFSAPAGDGRYALALKHNAGGDSVLWPEGPVGGAVGKKAKKATQIEAVKFRNNALNANPAAGTSNDTRPLLTLVTAGASFPTPSIETPPVIDALTKKVYVYYTNALFEVDFSSPAAFADAVAGSSYTKFCMAWHGVPANNAAGVGGKRPGGAYNNRTKYVGNYTAPLPASDLSAMYVLSRTPTTDGAAPTTWNFALSKITLPLNAAASTLVAGSPTYTSLPGQAALTGTTTDMAASAYMATDPYSNTNNVYFGLANGRIYQYDR